MKFGRHDLHWRDLGWAERTCLMFWCLSWFVCTACIAIVAIYLWETEFADSSIDSSLHLLSAALVMLACSGMLLAIVVRKRRRRRVRVY